MMCAGSMKCSRNTISCGDGMRVESPQRINCRDLAWNKGGITFSPSSIQETYRVLRIEMRMFMKFKQYLPPGSSDGKAMISLKDGGTFGDLLDTLALPRDEPKLVIINGISRGVSNTLNAETLSDGDVVAIFPPSGGG